MISGAARDRARDARAPSPASIVVAFEGYASGGRFPASRPRSSDPSLAIAPLTHPPPSPPATFAAVSKHEKIVDMSVVTVNAMTRAVVAPKAAGAKPRASAFVGRPAALKARVAGTRASPHEPTLARNLDLVLFPSANE